MEINPIIKIWLDSRVLTRKTADFFEEDDFLNFSPCEDLRSYAKMFWEVHSISHYLIYALINDDWQTTSWPPIPSDKNGFLSHWDLDTEMIENDLSHVDIEKLLDERDILWGRQTVYKAIYYVLANEAHHRGQAYTYLRELKISPPDFHLILPEVWK